MFVNTKFVMAALVFSSLAFGGQALGQQPETGNQATAVRQSQRGRVARRGMSQRRGLPMLRVLRRLNLTEDQKQQVRSTLRGQVQSTQAQRQELRQLQLQRRDGTITPEGIARAKELRAQLAESRTAVRAELAGILTDEQKMRLQTMIKARRAGHLSGNRPQIPG